MHPLAVGMYWKLLLVQCGKQSSSNDCSLLPANLEKLRAITGATEEEFERYWPEVAEKFTPAADGYCYNERMQSEMGKKFTLAEKRAKAGQKGGKQSSSKAQAKGVAKIKPTGSRKLEVGSRKKEEGRRKTEESPDVQAVWDHYKTKRPKVRVLGDDVRKKIVARLAEGFTADDLVAAIDGNFRSPHHCGQNDTGTEYHELELIVRDSKHVNQFINVPEAVPVLSQKNRRTAQAAQSFLDLHAHGGTQDA